MKLKIAKIFLLTFLAVIISSFSYQNSVDVKLMFVTYNGYGNNLYVDNISIGKIKDYSVSVAAIYNIRPDTTFVADSTYIFIPLKAVFINTGRNPISNLLTSIRISEFGYDKADTLTVLNSGQAVLVTFDTLQIPTGVKFNITLNAQMLNDTLGLGVNDSLIQNSIFLKGVTRNILLEEFTSSVSPGCGIMDPYLDLFVNNNYNDICAVRYHCGIPSPPYDSMYLMDSIQSNQRRGYYFTSSVPTTILDGAYPLPLPYSSDSILYSNLYDRLYEGSPLSVSVSDIRLPGDTIQTTVNLNVLFPLSPVGNYRLRVMAVERLVNYSTHQIGSGLSQFYDVFRTMVTDSTGFTINTTPGNYSYVFKYYRNPLWVDSMIYTTAFVQDDNFKKVLNSGKSGSFTPDKKKNIYSFFKKDFKAENYSLERLNKQYFKPLYSSNKTLKIDSLTKRLFEGFESAFPPKGWTLKNSDAYFSFEKFKHINGVTLGGFASMRMPFYDYSNIGAKDTLVTATYSGVTASDTLSFDWAYAMYLSTYIDSLSVLISIDGGTTYDPVFSKGGITLATAPSTTTPFAPNSSSEWRTFILPMSNVIPTNSYTGKNNMNFEIFQNYPNPFNPKTTINYNIIKDNYFTLKLYDITGRQISVLINNEFIRKGCYSFIFNASNLSSGIYFYVMSSDNFYDTKKMIVLK